MGYIILAVVAAFLLLGGVAKCEHNRAEEAGKTVKLQAESIAALEVINAKVAKDAKDANDAVAALKAEEAKRVAASAAAQAKAAASRAALERELQRLLSEKPAFPEDTCKSACFALRQPLP